MQFDFIDLDSVEVQVFDLQFIARPGERRTHGFVVMGKDSSITANHNPLLKHDLPRVIAR